MKKIKIYFTIYLENSKFFERVFSNLKFSNFQVLKIGKQSIEILAIKNVLSCMEANNLHSYILSLDGVEDAIPSYEYIDEKEKWYKTSIIPIILSSVITALTILAIVHPLKEVDDTSKAISILVPTSITVLIQIIYRYYREDSVL